jgi:hypothetical protein
LLHRVNTNEFAGATLVLKLYDTVNQCKERVVFTSANIIPWLPARASLPGNDVAAKNSFAAKLLEA